MEIKGSNSEHKTLYNAFLHSIKISGYKVGIKFGKDTLAAEQNNYLPKIVNVYIVYNLDENPKLPPKIFKLKKIFLRQLI